MSQIQTTHNATDLPDFCYLKVSIAGQIQPKAIVIRLHKEACPKTCRNFVALCTNDERTCLRRPMATYCGSQFHRVIPNFMCQAGDFERFDGTGGYSPIYHGGRFNDENLTGKHDQEGVVSMANAGKNTNKSQFFITLKAAPHLDGKHVIFGQVVSGMESVHTMTTVEREGDRPVPLQRIVISDCGIGRGDKEKDAHSQKNNDESDRKHNKKKRKRDSKSKRRYKDEDGSRHRDRKKRRKHRHSHREDDSNSSSDSSSSVSSNDNIRDDSQHRRKRRYRSNDDRHGRKKHSSHKKSRSSSKRKRRRRSVSRSSSDCTSYSSDSRDSPRDHERRRKYKHKSRHS